jgi:hypothetical protein
MSHLSYHGTSFSTHYLLKAVCRVVLSTVLSQLFPPRVHLFYSLLVEGRVSCCSINCLVTTISTSSSSFLLTTSWRPCVVLFYQLSCHNCFHLEFIFCTHYLLKAVCRVVLSTVLSQLFPSRVHLLSLWLSRFCFSAGNKWRCLGDEFPRHSRSRCLFLSCEVIYNLNLFSKRSLC